MVPSSAIKAVVPKKARSERKMPEELRQRTL
jgi:hypothetical protein